MSGPEQKDEPIVAVGLSSAGSFSHNAGAPGAHSCNHVCLINSPTQEMAVCSAGAASPLGDKLVRRGVFPQDDQEPSCLSRNDVWDAATVAVRDSDGGEASLGAASYFVPMSEAWHVQESLSPEITLFKK